MTPAVEFRGIVKTFGGVTALDGVTLAVLSGECHALIGENGAGKSTLGKILAGIHRPDNGTLLLAGQAVRFRSPADASRSGVGMVHQELAFCPDLSVAENLCLGRYPRRLRFLDRGGMHARAGQLLSQIGVSLDVRAPLRRLSTAQEQMVQIAAAVGTGARILVFDEPTSSLSDAESRRLFALIEDLRRRGSTILYVSHRMPEIFRLADRISVLRDGRYVGTVERSAAREDTLVQMMIGRPLDEYLPSHATGQRPVPHGQRPVPHEYAEPGAIALRVERLSCPGQFRDVSLTVRAGEVVGLAGLVGAGRSELARAIFGLEPRVSGNVFVQERRLPAANVRAAMQAGIGLIPEDRKRQGLVLMMSCRGNFSLAILERLRRLWRAGRAPRVGWLDRSGERRAAVEQFARLNVRTPSLEVPVSQLSGGNQQKVVLARWLARRLTVLIADEPTRGVDIGAKAAIHALLDELASHGLAILLISSELPELLRLSSRIIVLREGQLVGELSRSQATQESVLRLMAGVSTANTEVTETQRRREQ